MLRRVLAAAAASAVTRVVRGVLDDEPPGGPQQWARTNHRGEPVSLLGGPAVAAGLLAGSVVGAPSVRDAAALSVATASSCGFGLVDDLTEDRDGQAAKGLRGHLGAMAHGELTTGGLKVLGIGAGAVLAAALARPHGRRPGGRAARAGLRLLEVGMDGALIAGTANLVNLLDLRPGRALKAGTIAAAPAVLAGGPGSGPAAAVLGAAWAQLPDDLAEQDMLGDSGANALGAVLGTVAVQRCPRAVRAGLLAGVVALTVTSEKVSFTQVIARTPVLREIDGWGRRPVHDAGATVGDGTTGTATTSEAGPTAGPGTSEVPAR